MTQTNRVLVLGENIKQTTHFTVINPHLFSYFRVTTSYLLRCIKTMFLRLHQCLVRVQHTQPRGYY